MEPRSINQEVAAHLEHPFMEPQTRRTFDELGHVESWSDITFPDAVYAEDDLTGADVNYGSTKDYFRRLFCFVHG